jgi:hypothetical protein
MFEYKWENLGLIYAPNFDLNAWSKSHAQVPTGVITDSEIKVYFATRDSFQQSRTTFVALQLDDPTKLLYVHDEPVLQLGKPGEFDENGAMVGSIIVLDDGTVYMYYTGWRKTVSVPYLLSIGLAISTDGGVSFKRAVNAPIVGISEDDPLMTMSPFVIKDSKGWHMWYGSGISWQLVKGNYEPIYLIRYAQSQDGIQWESTPGYCLGQSYEHESNVRPSVIRNGSQFEMYFCHRGTYDYRNGVDSYQIGRALSSDGIKWTRDPDFKNFNLPRANYLSNMMAYPNIVQNGNKAYCFLNGNSFGKEGFGIIKGSDSSFG